MPARYAMAPLACSMAIRLFSAPCSWAVSCGGAPAVDELAILTDQERRILDLIVDWITNRQIGEHMHLAEQTPIDGSLHRS